MKSDVGAYLVVDLGFGDAGKGLVTDYLVRNTGARLVVRFNGGAQAGHNVVSEEGQQHTFSQLGAGSFVPGVRTHLGRDVIVHPTALRVEAELFTRSSGADVLTRVSVDPDCRVTTPFQQAAGRIRELRRGDTRHGSCGVGVGETAHDSLHHPELTLRFADLREPQACRTRLSAQRELKVRELAGSRTHDADPALRQELLALTDDALAERWLRAASEVARAVRCVPDEELGAQDAPVVLEGAQGVLLDERFGFHPHTTYSKTTFDGASELLTRWRLCGPIVRLGVLRAHAIRHGAGPLPTEDPALLAGSLEAHNATGPWQGRVRKGWPDLLLYDYALRACRGIDQLALTHLDAMASFERYRYARAYDDIARLELPRSIAEQEALTRALQSARPRYELLRGRSATERTAELCGLLESCGGHTQVTLTSFGPKARDVVRR